MFIVGGIVIAALVIFGGAAFLFAQLFTGHVKTPQEYRTVTLTAGTYAATVTCEGTIGPDIVAEVKPQASGTIASISVKEGDAVSKGMSLMTVSNPDIINAVQTNQTAYDQAKAALDQAQQVAAQAQSDLDKVNGAKASEQQRLDAANASAKAADADAPDQTIDPVVRCGGQGGAEKPRHGKGQPSPGARKLRDGAQDAQALPAAARPAHRDGERRRHRAQYSGKGGR